VPVNTDVKYMSEVRIVAVVLLAFSGILSLPHFGVSWAALKFAIAIAALLAIPLYFEIRRSKAPTPTETFLAIVWLWIRRNLGTVMAAIFISLSYGYAFGSLSKNSGLGGRLMVAVITLIMAIAMVYFAWVGQGPQRGQLKDDIKLHKENKRRYKWKI
jgi:hypothetical protein